MRGHDVYLVQSTCATVGEHLLELLLMAVIPYFGHAREDRRAHSGVALLVAVRPSVQRNAVIGVRTSATGSNHQTSRTHSGSRRRFASSKTVRYSAALIGRSSGGYSSAR